MVEFSGDEPLCDAWPVWRSRQTSSV